MAAAAREDEYRINRMIDAPEVRLIDENGNMVGVVSLREALARAEEVGLDLVEISPTARPPPSCSSTPSFPRSWHRPASSGSAGRPRCRP